MRPSVTDAETSIPEIQTDERDRRSAWMFAFRLGANDGYLREAAVARWIAACPLPTPGRQSTRVKHDVNFNRK